MAVSFFAKGSDNTKYPRRFFGKVVRTGVTEKEPVFAYVNRMLTALSVT